MEDTLRVFEDEDNVDLEVLILVLMEDTLRGNKKSSGRRSKTCLNPCFNGRYSQRNNNYTDVRDIVS